MKPILFFVLIVFSGFTSVAQTAGSTSIEFENKVIDYGSIKKGEDGKRTFLFTNTGNEPFVISDIFSSCTCDIISKPDMPIEPGEKGKIVVTYDTKKLGPIVKTLTVKGNSTPGIIALKLKGTVVE
ncbi:Protein of unknown function [Nonlabens sp. Hel1_33_55]|uniref:DUF1573 domain-containing protein n=1 Tax=Nonlabens sp. Hel1_33_55 TaxID=1336802 RepID=UPI000875D05E|nr:DUF1573 domain-containing protein [Nonlabens sp. Hel1_33_55]SCY22524.1 Protein of unknown function [Nonlabens sp. Hel1_33_55]